MYGKLQGRVTNVKCVCAVNRRFWGVAGGEGVVARGFSSGELRW